MNRRTIFYIILTLSLLLLLSAFLGGTLGCLGAICVAAVVYVVLVIALKVITYDDCMLLPGGEKIAKILRVRA